MLIAGCVSLQTRSLFEYVALRKCFDRMPLSMGAMIGGWDEMGPGLYYVNSEGERLKVTRFSVRSGSTYMYSVMDIGYKWSMSMEEAVELGRRALYHASFRDGASGGVVSVFYVGPDGWKEMALEGVGELHDRWL